MFTYYVTVACCLFLLVMLPLWSGRPDQQGYPFSVIVLLGFLAMVVPMFIRRRKREGSATPGDLGVSIANRD